MPVKEAEPRTQPSVAPVADKARTLPETKTFSQADVDQARRDGQNATLGEIGKWRTEAKKAQEAMTASETRLNRMIKEQDERELEEVRDDPPKLSALQERQKRRAVESELTTTQTELTQKNERLQQLETERAETQMAQTVQEVAIRFKVDPIRLAKLAKRTDGSLAEIEDLAKELPTGNPPRSLKPDSGGAIGGSISREQIIADYSKNPRDPVARERYLALRREEGR